MQLLTRQRIPSLPHSTPPGVDIYLSAHHAQAAPFKCKECVIAPISLWTPSCNLRNHRPYEGHHPCESASAPVRGQRAEPSLAILVDIRGRSHTYSRCPTLEACLGGGLPHRISLSSFSSRQPAKTTNAFMLPQDAPVRRHNCVDCKCGSICEDKRER